MAQLATVPRPRFDLIAPIKAAGASLQNPHFRLFWFTNAIFFIGQGLILMGAQWLMLDLTASRSLLGLVGALQGVTILLLSPLGGVLADRVPRRNLLIVARSLSALIFIGMAVLIFTHHMRIGYVFASVVGAGAVLAFTQAATQTYVFDLVGKERLTNAIALNTLGSALFQIIGPSIGGILLASIGSKGTYLAGGSGYLIGAGLLFLIPIVGKSAAPARAGSFLNKTWGDLAEGCAFIRTDKTLLWLFVMTGVAFFGGAVTTMRPVFARDIFHAGAHGLGTLATCFGAGALTGALLVASMGDRLKRKGLILLLAQMWWMLATVLYAISPSFALNCLLEALMGIALPFWQSLTVSTIQIRVPAALRNRVLTVFFMMLSSMSINWWVTGQFADWLGDRRGLWIMGGAGVACDLLILIFVRRIVLLGTSKHPIVPVTLAPRPPADASLLAKS